ncbi:MAG TPA: 50S ribosomal protein L6 [Lentisphaeria bacterium]|nr:MAG: 50S ribosomal protein L6 [Lentisphaerae bacterium GWF2_50_93]HCE43458.1 50S ribosomal protein L6 [Lentisphaeria bacterium]
MSRIGKKPLPIPQGVKATPGAKDITIEGPKGKLTKALPPMTSVKIENGILQVNRADESRTARTMHGLARSLIAGMVVGVTEGYKKDLEIVGVGYKAQLTGQKITLNLGYSHPIVYNVPEGIKVVIADNTKMNVSGIDKQLVGEVAATLRRFKKPEPYKGKGVRYANEHITIKEGKTVA